MGYKEYQPQRGPGFLRGNNGGVLTGALGAEKDYQLDVCRQSLLAGYPGAGSVVGGVPVVTSVMLDQIGVDLTTPRTTAETDIAYEARLRTAAASLLAGPLAAQLPGMLVRIDRAGFPTANLDLIGADRRLPRAMPVVSGAVVPETDAAYGERLRVAWDDPAGPSFAGTRESLLLALIRAGFPGTYMYIIERNSFYYGYFSGALVVHDGTAFGGLDWSFDSGGHDMWNQFGIIFDGPTLFNGVPLVAGSPGAIQLDKIVKAWKPAKARYMGAKVMDTGPFWNWPLVGARWDAATRIWSSIGSGIGVVYDIPPL